MNLWNRYRLSIGYSLGLQTRAGLVKKMERAGFLEGLAVFIMAPISRKGEPGTGLNHFSLSWGVYVRHSGGKVLHTPALRL